jgi:hypothetical protein
MAMTPDEREDAKLALDRDRYELDKRRVVVEESKSRTDNLFLNRRFPVLVTAIVSAAAVFFSYVQMHVASEDKERELALAREKSDQEFRLAAAKFVTDNSKLIFEGNNEEQLRIRNVILASFPPSISNALFARFEQSATSTQAATTWSEAQKVTAAIIAKPEQPATNEPRIFLHYQDPADAALMDSLMSRLRAAGYRVPGRQLVTQSTQGDIRYYHDDDAPAVDLVKPFVEQFLAESGRPLTLKRIGLGKQYPNIPKGVIEVWIPKRN